MSKKLWFKRRRFGWGWVPVTLEGWLSLVVFLVIIAWATAQMPVKPAQPTTSQLIQYFVIAIVDVALLIGIAFTKGPEPHWRWGKKSTDDKHEDF